MVTQADRRKGWKPNWILVFLMIVQLATILYQGVELKFRFISLEAVVMELKEDFNTQHPRH